MTTLDSTQILELDVRGQICPSTLLTALREINANREALRSGAVCLAILTDNRDATATIPAAASNMGYRSQVVRDGAHYVITVEGGLS